MMTQLSDPPPHPHPSPSRAHRAGRLLHWLLLIAALVPMLLLAQWVWRYGVNVPHWDQWGMVYLFDLAEHGKLRWEHLFQQHNESRKVFPKLLFIGMGRLTGWNVRYEMAVSVLMAAITSLNILILARRTVAIAPPPLPQWPWAPAALWLLANLLIFSPVQHENWLWGIQIVVFTPILMLTTGLVVTTARARLGIKALLCALLALIATFSYANGLLVWVLLGAALVVLNWRMQDGSGRRGSGPSPGTPGEGWVRALLRGRARPTLSDTLHWWPIGLYAIAFILSASFYFYDYHRPPWHPSITDGLKQPINMARYFLAFLGSPLRLGFDDPGRQLAWARWAGTAVVIMFGICCFYIIARRRRHALLHCMTPWLLIGAYALISAFITAGGRVSFGKMQALESRYTSFAVYLPVALVFMSAIVLAHLAAHTRRRTAPRWAGAAATLLILTLLFAHVLSSIPAVHRMQDARRTRLEGMAMLHWLDLADEPMIQRRLHPMPERLRELAEAANRLGLLIPPMAESPVPLDASEPTVRYGHFDGLRRVNGELFASGWAMLPHRGEPADAVLLTWQLEGRQPLVFAVVTERYERRDVARHLNDKQLRLTGWRRVIQNHDLPDHALIAAWAFDAQTALAYRLAQQHPPPAGMTNDE